MREDAWAEDVLLELHGAVTPFVDLARAALPAIPKTPDLRALIHLQLTPLVATLVLEGPTTSLQAVRLVGASVPGHAALEDAVERFLGAGLSAMPGEVVDGVMFHAAKPGAGLWLAIDLERGDVTAYEAISRCDLSRSVPLFSCVVGATPAEPPGFVTAH